MNSPITLSDKMGRSDLLRPPRIQAITLPVRLGGVRRYRLRLMFAIHRAAHTDVPVHVTTPAEIEVTHSDA
jgi:hypothetical protein